MPEQIRALVARIRAERDLAVQRLQLASTSQKGHAAANDPAIEAYVRTLRERVNQAELLLAKWEPLVEND